MTLGSSGIFLHHPPWCCGRWRGERLPSRPRSAQMQLCNLGKVLFCRPSISKTTKHFQGTVCRSQIACETSSAWQGLSPATCSGSAPEANRQRRAKNAGGSICHAERPEALEPTVTPRTIRWANFPRSGGLCSLPNGQAMANATR